MVPTPNFGSANLNEIIDDPVPVFINKVNKVKKLLPVLKRLSTVLSVRENN
jgi:hypothetical protein